jgi:putative lipoprotein
MRAMIVVAAAVLVGCRAEPPADAPAGQSARTPVAAAAPRIVRFACEDLTVSVLFDDSRAVLTTGPSTVTLHRERAASGARFGGDGSVFWTKGDEATLTRDGRTRACRVLRDPWREAQARGVDFRAVGQEPGWHLEISYGHSIRLVYDYGERELTTDVPPPGVPQPGTTTYRAITTSHRLDIVIEERACSDVMSGQPFPRAVTVTIDDRSLHGCGRPLEVMRWSASARQVGPVRIGMTVPETEAALGAPFEPLTGTAECVYRRSPASPRGVLFMQVGGRIVRVDVIGFEVPTDAGIGVGASEMDVRDAYGAMVSVSPHKYVTGGHYLTVAADGTHRLVFETDGQWVTRYRAGRLPEVESVEGCS